MKIRQQCENLTSDILSPTPDFLGSGRRKDFIKLDKMAESEAAAGSSFVLGSLIKKIRRLLQGKRHIKIELCVRLSVLLLLHLCHVIRNRRSALLFVWHEWFSCKGRELKIYRCEI